MCTGSNGDNDCGVISATNAATSNMSRIVGGVDSDIKVYPWQVRSIKEDIIIQYGILMMVCCAFRFHYNSTLGPTYAVEQL